LVCYIVGGIWDDKYGSYIENEQDDDNSDEFVHKMKKKDIVRVKLYLFSGKNQDLFFFSEEVADTYLF
jgi:hypothetical protein